MKKCPFCAEDIQNQAIKCKHCGEFLDKKPANKWYFKPTWIVLAFLCAGPFALPLIWIHPRLKKRNKALITLIALLLTLIISLFVIKAIEQIWEYYKLIF